MSLKSRKLQCILCNGVISYDDSKVRFKEHLDQDHSVIAETGQSWVMAVSLLDLERREKILATIIDNIEREPRALAESTGQQQTPMVESSGQKNGDRTKVILNIDISDDEADGDWDKNFDKITTQDRSFVELDESFGAGIDEEKLVEENTSSKESSRQLDNEKHNEENTVESQNDKTETIASFDNELGNKMDLFECRFCTYKSKTSFVLKKHLSKYHSINDTDLKEEAVQSHPELEEKDSEDGENKKMSENVFSSNKKKGLSSKKNPQISKRFVPPEAEKSDDKMAEEKRKGDDTSKLMEEIDRFSQSLKRKMSSELYEEAKRRKTLPLSDETNSASDMTLPFETKETLDENRDNSKEN